MNAVVLVPWRDTGCPHRLANWHMVRRWWAEDDWLVVPADDGGNPFSRACSLNLAHDIVPADVYVIADADTLPHLGKVREACSLALDEPGMVVAFDRYRYLTPEGTELALSGERRGWGRHVDFTLENTVSSCVAVSASTWDTVHGFDLRFRGWGHEDVAFEVACDTLAGPTRWIPGDVWHLWHPTEPYRPAVNEELSNEYHRARGNPAEMRRVIGARCNA